MCHKNCLLTRCNPMRDICTSGKNRAIGVNLRVIFAYRDAVRR